MRLLTNLYKACRYSTFNTAAYTDGDDQCVMGRVHCTL